MAKQGSNPLNVLFGLKASPKTSPKKKSPKKNSPPTKKVVSPKKKESKKKESKKVVSPKKKASKKKAPPKNSQQKPHTLTKFKTYDNPTFSPINSLNKSIKRLNKI